MFSHEKLKVYQKSLKAGEWPKKTSVAEPQPKENFLPTKHTNGHEKKKKRLHLYF